MDHNKVPRTRSPHEADTSSRGGAASLVQPWLRLSEQLTPLIGESGFCALFGRALRLSVPCFEGLSTCDSARPVADLFMSLTRTLNEIGPGQAGAANGALLETFTTLLGTLIGEALTKQLLHVAQVGGEGQTHGQEQK
ncbi:MAG: hypothetical protein JWQ80_1542 [Massilia sp.]|nr:hypothetical protein [Massilia sp.]